MSVNTTSKGSRPRASIASSAEPAWVTTWPCDVRSSQTASRESAPDDYIAKVPSEVVEGVPANIPRALLPEYITDLILKRSVRIGKIRHLRII
jgi:hypothetical protein